VRDLPVFAATCIIAVRLRRQRVPTRGTPT